MNCKRKVVSGAKAVAVVAAVVLCSLCVCFVSCNEEADDDTSNMSKDDWATLLASYSDGDTITLSSSLTASDLVVFAEALVESGLSNITVDMSQMTITEINEKTFYPCSNISSVILPSCVKIIGDYAFYYCSKLTSITIPEGITSIGKYAFAHCPDLETAVIGDGVETIPRHIFWDCTSLTTVTIGSAVTTIIYGAFGYCSALETVYYNGTTSEWDEISISSSNNSCLTNATIICSDGHVQRVAVWTPPPQCTLCGGGGARGTTLTAGASFLTGRLAMSGGRGRLCGALMPCGV